MTRSQIVSGRELTLDFVKGILVIVMVVYHMMNYFTNATAEDYVYVRFVSGSFIFISGYIISTFCERRYDIDKAGISQRLLMRGLKLLLLFTLLNVLKILTGMGNPNKLTLNISQFLNSFKTIYLLGDIMHASFQILLPISYVLMLSPLLLRISRFIKLQIVLICVAMSLYSLFDIHIMNVRFLLVGMAGFSIGLVTNKINKGFFVENRIAIIFCFFAFFYFSKYANINILTYVIGIIIILKLFYDLGKMFNLSNNLGQTIILFGQYTLVCYIAQIVFLQGLSWLLLRQTWGFGYQIIAIFIITNLFLFILCSLLRSLRRKYSSIEFLYRYIFA